VCAACEEIAACGRTQNSITQREIWMQQGVRTEGRQPPSGISYFFSTLVRARGGHLLYIRIFTPLSLSISHFGPDVEVICVSAFYYARQGDVISDYSGCAADFWGVREKKWTICRCHVDCQHVWVIMRPLRRINVLIFHTLLSIFTYILILLLWCSKEFDSCIDVPMMQVIQALVGFVYWYKHRLVIPTLTI